MADKNDFMKLSPLTIEYYSELGNLKNSPLAIKHNPDLPETALIVVPLYFIDKEGKSEYKVVPSAYMDYVKTYLDDLKVYDNFENSNEITEDTKRGFELKLLTDAVQEFREVQPTLDLDTLTPDQKIKLKETINDYIDKYTRVDKYDKDFLPHLNTGKSTSIAISKVAKNQMQIIEQGKYGLNFDVGGKGKNKATVITKATPSIQGFDKIEPYDKIIQDTIGTLIQASNDNYIKVTPAQIYRKLAGLTDSEFVSANSLKEVAVSIEKMRGIRATIDFRDQANKHKGLKIKEGTLKILDDYIINTTRAKIEMSGKDQTVYIFRELPIFYKYSLEVNQIITTQTKLLNTSMAANKALLKGRKTRKNTRNFINLKHYLLQQIEQMKSESEKGRHENRRKYETIFKGIGIENPTSKQKETLRYDVDYYLNFLKSEKHIKNFSKYKTGRAYAGVTIIL